MKYCSLKKPRWAKSTITNKQPRKQLTIQVIWICQGLNKFTLDLKTADGFLCRFFARIDRSYHNLTTRTKVESGDRKKETRRTQKYVPDETTDFVDADWHFSLLLTTWQFSLLLASLVTKIITDCIIQYLIVISETNITLYSTCTYNRQSRSSSIIPHCRCNQDHCKRGYQNPVDWDLLPCRRVICSTLAHQNVSCGIWEYPS